MRGEQLDRTLAALPWVQAERRHALKTAEEQRIARDDARAAALAASSSTVLALVPGHGEEDDNAEATRRAIIAAYLNDEGNRRASDIPSGFR